MEQAGGQGRGVGGAGQFLDDRGLAVLYLVRIAAVIIMEHRAGGVGVIALIYPQPAALGQFTAQTALQAFQRCPSRMSRPP